MAAENEAHTERVKVALNQVKTGQVKCFKNAKAVLKQLE